MHRSHCAVAQAVLLRVLRALLLLRLPLPMLPQAVCRAGKEMDTAQTVQLPAGTAVQVVDVAQVGPRKRVCVKAEGMKGWLSEVSVR